MKRERETERRERESDDVVVLQEQAIHLLTWFSTRFRIWDFPRFGFEEQRERERGREREREREVNCISV